MEHFLKIRWWWGRERFDVICDAFDKAWHSIADHYAGDPHAIDEARKNLAKAVLVAAAADNRDDAKVLKLAACRAVLSQMTDTSSGITEPDK